MDGSMFKRVVSSFVLFTFLLSSVGINGAYAQALNLPIPGTMVGPSASLVPVTLKGLKVHLENPLLFDFIIDSGTSGVRVESPAFKEESQKLIKYFLASLTIREDDLWVNLSPYEKDRMTTDELGKTTLGQDMLAQDYILKQLTASLIYPEKDLGKAFWSRVYAQAQEKFGAAASDIPVDTFNKVWITADKAKVLEKNGAAYILDGHLKVMIESDYLAESMEHGAESEEHRAGSIEQKENSNNSNNPSMLSAPSSMLAQQVLKDIIIPEIEKEVNEGANFAPLRQMFHSMILATWYKTALKSALLNQVYSNKGKTSGVLSDDPASNEKVYSRYLEAYRKGVFNYIKEETSPAGESVPRKYFSGGLAPNLNITLDRAQSASPAELAPAGALAQLTLQVAGTSTVDFAASPKSPRATDGLAPIKRGSVYSWPAEDQRTMFQAIGKWVSDNQELLDTSSRAADALARAFEEANGTWSAEADKESITLTFYRRDGSGSFSETSTLSNNRGAWTFNIVSRRTNRQFSDLSSEDSMTVVLSPGEVRIEAFPDRKLVGGEVEPFTASHTTISVSRIGIDTKNKKWVVFVDPATRNAVRDAERYYGAFGALLKDIDFRVDRDAAMTARPKADSGFALEQRMRVLLQEGPGGYGTIQNVDLSKDDVTVLLDAGRGTAHIPVQQAVNGLAVEAQRKAAQAREVAFTIEPGDFGGARNVRNGIETRLQAMGLRAQDLAFVRFEHGNRALPADERVSSSLQPGKSRLGDMLTAGVRHPITFYGIVNAGVKIEGRESDDAMGANYFYEERSPFDVNAGAGTTNYLPRAAMVEGTVKETLRRIVATTLKKEDFSTLVFPADAPAEISLRWLLTRLYDLIPQAERTHFTDDYRVNAVYRTDEGYSLEVGIVSEGTTSYVITEDQGRVLFPIFEALLKTLKASLEGEFTVSASPKRDLNDGYMTQPNWTKGIILHFKPKPDAAMTTVGSVAIGQTMLFDQFMVGDSVTLAVGTELYEISQGVERLSIGGQPLFSLEKRSHALPGRVTIKAYGQTGFFIINHGDQPVGFSGLSPRIQVTAIGSLDAAGQPGQAPAEGMSSDSAMTVARPVVAPVPVMEGLSEAELDREVTFKSAKLTVRAWLLAIDQIAAAVKPGFKSSWTTVFSVPVPDEESPLRIRRADADRGIAVRQAVMAMTRDVDLLVESLSGLMAPEDPVNVLLGVRWAFFRKAGTLEKARQEALQWLYEAAFNLTQVVPQVGGRMGLLRTEGAIAQVRSELTGAVSLTKSLQDDGADIFEVDQTRLAAALSSLGLEDIPAETEESLIPILRSAAYSLDGMPMIRMDVLMAASPLLRSIVWRLDYDSSDAAMTLSMQEVQNVQQALADMQSSKDRSLFDRLMDRGVRVRSVVGGMENAGESPLIIWPDRIEASPFREGELEQIRQDPNLMTFTVTVQAGQVFVVAVPRGTARDIAWSAIREAQDIYRGHSGRANNISQGMGGYSAAAIARGDKDKDLRAALQDAGEWRDVLKSMAVVLVALGEPRATVSRFTGIRESDFPELFPASPRVEYAEIDGQVFRFDFETSQGTMDWYTPITAKARTWGKWVAAYPHMHPREQVKLALAVGARYSVSDENLVKKSDAAMTEDAAKEEVATALKRAINVGSRGRGRTVNPAVLRQVLAEAGVSDVEEVAIALLSPALLRSFSMRQGAVALDMNRLVREAPLVRRMVENVMQRPDSAMSQGVVQDDLLDGPADAAEAARSQRDQVVARVSEALKHALYVAEGQSVKVNRANLEKALRDLGKDPEAVDMSALEQTLKDSAFLLDGYPFFSIERVISNSVLVRSIVDGLTAQPMIPDKAMATDDPADIKGGIDLNAKNMGLDVARDGEGVEIKLDPAMVAEFQKGNFTGVEGIILRITPIQSVLPILGMAK
jgi:hypothetical protein